MLSIQRRMDGLVSADEGICQDSDWAMVVQTPHKRHREWKVKTTHPNRPYNDALVFARTRQELSIVAPFQTPYFITMHL